MNFLQFLLNYFYQRHLFYDEKEYGKCFDFEKPKEIPSYETSPTVQLKTPLDTFNKIFDDEMELEDENSSLKKKIEQLKFFYKFLNDDEIEGYLNESSGDIKKAANSIHQQIIKQLQQ